MEYEIQWQYNPEWREVQVLTVSTKEGIIKYRQPFRPQDIEIAGGREAVENNAVNLVKERYRRIHG